LLLGDRYAHFEGFLHFTPSIGVRELRRKKIIHQTVLGKTYSVNQDLDRVITIYCGQI
jgi:hypothetical protein